jgi:hypothetical protein
MKIGLISDTHGSIKTFRKVLDGPFKDVQLILHAGDVLYRGSGRLTNSRDKAGLADELNSLQTPIMIARGNCDSDADQQILNTPLMWPYVFLYAETKRLMVMHGDGKKEEDLESLIRKFSLAVLVHGHSHIPRIRRFENSLIVNPGTPTIPNPSSPFKKTAGVLDTLTGTAKIYDIDTMIPVLTESFRL